MSLRTLSDIKLSIEAKEEELFKLATKRLGQKPKHFAITKKSLDARNKSDLKYVYTIEFSTQTPPKKPQLERLPKNKLPQKRVAVVGSGPAGLFCALRLIERGITPIVIERGASVEERERDIEKFIGARTLNLQSNVQFGEGGAGTFSDGKLNTQTHSPINREVLQTFVRFGAPEEILWLNKPHIGSDNLKKVVKNMREYILANGGKVCFHSRMTDIKIKGGEVKSITIENGEGAQTLEVSALVLAIGHSARDTFELLRSKGFKMTAKDFAVGVRIEHLQKEIGFSQYGSAYEKLPAADYKLTSHVERRAAFTFCMCPGGFVMPAASEAGGVVTNGMSNYARNERNANAALIVQVYKTDFGADFEKNPLAGVEFQRTIERKAFEAGGGDYRAPVQLVGDFLRGRASDQFGAVAPTYAAGTAFSDLRAVLPDFVSETLKGAIVDMDKRLKGFANPEAVLTAAETRTSSPVRIERGEDMQSVFVKGVYPCGEGAGYAGGITSSAADGIRAAEAIYQSLLNGCN
ncbi:MAG: FAD-dependent monooxygenase [Clostridia bacterium]|nr:FAD-dependent monooxygenase [Clostridia bacterium]